ncbi:hypothetical protein ICU_05129 [Bacillus cereus BAG2X1-1]|nr:hypothetical protein ICU_05129 [Bacillus cereus BAG2X1-1]
MTLNSLQLSRVGVRFDRDHRNNENKDKEKIEQYVNSQSTYISQTVDEQNSRIDEIVGASGGNDVIEVVDARVEGDGTKHKILRTRLNVEAARTKQSFNDLAINIRQPPFLAIGDGKTHKLSERFTTLAEAQRIFTTATSLDDEIDQKAIEAAMEIATQTGARVLVPPSGGFYMIDTLIIKRGIVLEGRGFLKLKDTAKLGIVFDNVRDVTLNSIRIRVSGPNQKVLDFKNGAMENKFNQIRIDALEVFENTVGIELIDTWVNTFNGCEILMMAKGAVFNREANSNRFLGCSIRTDSEPTSKSICLIEHNDGHSNEFIGGDIERAKTHIKMNGGSLSLKGVYMEVATNPFGIEFNGGNLSLIGNYCLNEFIAISGGRKLTLIGNTWRGEKSNTGSPYVRYIADAPTTLYSSGNIMEHSEHVFYRTLQYYENGVWKNKTINNDVILDNNYVYDMIVSKRRKYSALKADYLELPPIMKLDNGREVTWGTAPPITGYSNQGAVIRNLYPTEGGILEWVCVTSGAPGTWEPVGLGAARSIGSTPLYLGQIAVANGVGYMAMGTNSKADWKQITN